MRLKSALNRGILNQEHLDFFEKRLLDPFLKNNSMPPSLCHGDFAPQNIIIDTDTAKIAGIIDFESAKYWIPDWDLTRVNAAIEYHGVNRDLYDSFLEGYVSVGRMNADDIKSQINYYKPFESLNYWVWGWDKPRFREEIKADVIKVTGIPTLDIN